MTKRIQKLVLAVAALAALALGGAVFAQAQTPSSATPPERTSAPDRDNVQTGDQRTPDHVAAGTRSHARVARPASADRPDGAAGRSDSQARAAGEKPGTESPETGAGSESGPANDGPGGHADPAGASVDHQFQGNE